MIKDKLPVKSVIFILNSYIYKKVINFTKYYSFVITAYKYKGYTFHSMFGQGVAFKVLDQNDEIVIHL